MDVTDSIAMLALVASVISLTYTITVDQRRPRMKVRGDVIYIFDRGRSDVTQQGPYFSISATNHGPGRVRAVGVGLTFRNPVKRWYEKFVKDNSVRGAVLEALAISPDHLPKWLEVGESLTLLYPSDGELLQENTIFDCLYIHDSLGKLHWAQPRVFASARQQLKESADETQGRST